MVFPILASRRNISASSVVNEVCPKSAQTRERLLSDHPKFSKRLAAVEYIVFEPQAEVGNAMYELIAEKSPPAGTRAGRRRARPSSDTSEIAKELA
jgi:hypothetical protein